MLKICLFEKRDARLVLVLLSVPVLLLAWVYYGKQASYEWFAESLGWPSGPLHSTLYEYLAAFFLMFVVPLALIKGASKRGMCELGFRVGDVGWGLRFTGLALPVMLLAAYVASLDPAVRAVYPLAGDAMCHLPTFLIVEAFYLFYYVGWEFFFRGFLLFGLEKQVGAVVAILVQTIPSALVHIGKPASESFAAIFAGVLFGYLALRTRSILYSFILHAAVGIGMDLFLVLW